MPFTGGGFRVGSATMYMTAFVRWIKALEEQGLSCVIYSAEYSKFLWTVNGKARQGRS
jgi:hypothetical protein